MSIAELTETGGKASFNKVDPNSLPDRLRSIKFGDVLRALPTTLVGRAAAAHDGYNVSTLQKIATAEDARAAAILRATVRAGGVTGELTPQAFGTTPATTQIAVAPNGEIVVLGTDAITDIDVLYVPAKYETIELELPVATGLLVIPSQYVTKKVLFLMEAEITAGSVTGKKVVLVPAAGLPATLQARLTVARDQVQFNHATDAGTKARIKLAVAPDVDLDAVLTSVSAF